MGLRGEKTQKRCATMSLVKIRMSVTALTLQGNDECLFLFVEREREFVSKRFSECACDTA